jgi:hypothetical protein
MEPNWLDERIAEVAGSAARPMTRRHWLGRTCDVLFKGSLVAVLGIANARKAWADACSCLPAHGHFCGDVGHACPSSLSVCPTNYGLCKKVGGVPQDGVCPWTTGFWTEDCGNGTCANCYDCWSGLSGSACTCRYLTECLGGGGGGDCGNEGDPCGEKCCNGLVCSGGSCVLEN